MAAKCWKGKYLKECCGECSAVDSRVIRAYRCIVDGFDNDGIVFTTSASKARYATKLNAADAGFKFDFREIRVVRAPEFDCRLTLDGKIPVRNRPFSPDYLQSV